MKTLTLPVGQMATNCYLVSDEKTLTCLIIDPGEDSDFITTTILENKLIPQAIILTHGHYDHCLAALDLKLNFSIPIYLHPKDLFLYEKAHLSAKHFSGLVIPKLPPIDHFLSDQEIITFGNSSLQVIHTPGHTPGSCCFVSLVKGRGGVAERDLNPLLFTGDTLFAKSIGRTDLSYSSKQDLQKSLKKILTLPRHTQIYPGHDNEFLLNSYQQV